MTTRIKLAPRGIQCRLPTGGWPAAAVYSVAASALAFLALGLAGCGTVPFLDRDPSLPRDRASRFDRFVDEVHLSLGDTAGPISPGPAGRALARAK